MDSNATNFNYDANSDDGSCQYYVCDDPNSMNYVQQSDLTVNPIEIYIDFDSKINRHEIYLDGKDWSISADLLDNTLQSKIANNENISFNYGDIDRNSLFKSLHQEYQSWIDGKGTYRNDLISNLDLIKFLGNN